jgi:hypothetical protein
MVEGYMKIGQKVMANKDIRESNTLVVKGTKGIIKDFLENQVGIAFDNGSDNEKIKIWFDVIKSKNYLG